MAAAQGFFERYRVALVVIGWTIAIALVIASLFVLADFLDRKFPDKPPKYSVAVAAVAGLDPARDLTARGRPTLSPVFNVTVHIDDRRNYNHASCIRDLSTATMSYGDAFLGKGTVPKFCALKRREGEGVARVWGQDLVVPWFLREQLAGELAAGEAAVDVELRLQWPELLVCKAKIGGGLTPCREPR